MWNRKKKARAETLRVLKLNLEQWTAEAKMLEALNQDLRRERDAKQNEVEGLHRELAGQRETAQMENNVLTAQMGQIMMRLRTMRNGVEQFREAMMQVDHGEPLATSTPPDVLDKIRDGLGIDRDGSTYRKPKSWS